jgi:hypothetical protein
MVAVSRGCPQEGVLSPLLWRLVVDDLITRLNGGGIHTQGCTGDICLLTVEKFPNTVLGIIQWALYPVEAWCDEGGLSVNPDKTGTVVLTRRRKNPGFYEPHILEGYFTSLYVGQVSRGKLNVLLTVHHAISV